MKNDRTGNHEISGRFGSLLGSDHGFGGAVIVFLCLPDLTTHLERSRDPGNFQPWHACFHEDKNPEDTLGMPEPELFEVIFEKRLELIAWLEQAAENPYDGCHGLEF